MIISRSLLVVRTRQKGLSNRSSALFLRWYSSRSNATTKTGRERMRVAVVGGGVSGLASALHLAPLVSKGLISSPIDIYEASPGGKGRDIGVGIWSTALEPFRTSDHPSHQVVWEKMTTQGSWIGEVGYRTPSGKWLVTSSLPTKIADESGDDMPGLLFLRECDVKSALRLAVAAEENNSTLRVHGNSPVEGIFELSPHAWSAPLMMDNGRMSERDYHLIVAADGINSALRQAYGGYSKGDNRRLTGTSTFRTSSIDEDSARQQKKWDAARHAEITSLEDRKYTVFRGNAPVAAADKGKGGLNFQTWGEGKSMRFATVNMTYPMAKEKGGPTEEKQVWFITIDDDDITSEPDVSKRKDLLLEAFRSWHEPICDMVTSTPPEEILMERAVAHSHYMAPVIDMNTLLQESKHKRPPSSGRGTAIVFVGDAFMTVDPILAQGFSFGMEGAADLPQPVEKSCVQFEDLLMDPYILREQLTERHERRLDRLLCLLRATEIVQALGQPRGGTFTGFLAKNLIRPAMRFTPGAVKRSVFNAMLKYSVGLPAFRKQR